MNHRVKSLLWLRWQFLQSNKFLLFVFLISPYVDAYLLRIFVEMMSGRGEEAGIAILVSGLLLGGLTYGNAAVFACTIAAEEKQKRNLRTLSLAGVTTGEYLLSTALIPFGAAIILGSVTPFLFGLPVTNWLLYFALLFVTVVTYLLVGLAIGLVLKNVAQATIVSMVLFLLSCLLPMFYVDWTWIQGFIDLSLMGASHTFLVTGSVKPLSLLALLIWFGLAAVLAVWAYQRNRKEER
ncbi:hypothetical protein JEQ21_05485 [Streptococcus sp. 121]|uniref:hypothetical protein n=1 Tax=Streptococcus sp. 121 TaxID=2797637 RepID=UPI0018F0F32F|nr:hypothetical protein [Streptococcus sp. 121]MBJ6745909.1 hypothetical protein [Streptococcus sp. 121]